MTERSHMVMTCEECGDRTPQAIWRNGTILCPECDGIENADVRGKPMARSWSEFRGKPRKPRSEGDRA